MHFYFPSALPPEQAKFIAILAFAILISVPSYFYVSGNYNGWLEKKIDKLEQILRNPSASLGSLVLEDRPSIIAENFNGGSLILVVLGGLLITAFMIATKDPSLWPALAAFLVLTMIGVGARWLSLRRVVFEFATGRVEISRPHLPVCSQGIDRASIDAVRCYQQAMDGGGFRTHCYLLLGSREIEFFITYNERYGAELVRVVAEQLGVPLVARGK